MTLSNVVLPQPDAPSATTNSLSRKSRLTLSSARTTPSPSTAGNSTVTWLRLTTAAIGKRASLVADSPGPGAGAALPATQQPLSRTIWANLGVALSE